MSKEAPQVLHIPAAAPVHIPPELLRWLCVNIIATQRVIQQCGMVNSRRLELAIENAEVEYQAHADQQEYERLRAASQISHEADARLGGNPFLTQMRGSFNVDHLSPMAEAVASAGKVQPE